MDYKAIGFKAGLEIHQQLDTHKLFCDCPSQITDRSDYSFERLLRPTQSEMGDVDKAALEEAQRKRRFVYLASHTSTCLVESDEEPPHTANEEAIDICLTMASLLSARPVEEVHFMRKIVIDGSNTTGFQRTALVAMDGRINNVCIDMIALEEDAARKLTEKGKRVNYGLDRLGVPLIEITTAADIQNPQQARDVAEQIGMLLRATKKVKKGLGTIRQDLNVSIAQGARVEIKGIQSLSSISKAAEKEAKRQEEVVTIISHLNKCAHKSDLDHIKTIDLTNVFSHCQSKIIQQQLQKKGCVLGIRLPGYHGCLKQEHSRLGRELAVYARLASGIGGIIHSDEMPGYGITEEEVNKVKHILKLEAHDAFVLAVGQQTVVEKALLAVLKRAKMFFDGVPEEVRRCLPDDSTEYMRPLPGAARMYPETDVPPTRISQERIDSLVLPEKPDEKRKRFMTQYSLNKEQTTQLLASGYEDDFEQLVHAFPKLTSIIIRTFLNTFPELKNNEVSLECITQDVLEKIFSGLRQQKYAKEALPDLLSYFTQHPKDSLEAAMDACNLMATDVDDIQKIISRVVTEKHDFICQRGEHALGPLMGLVMKELRGKADGELISKLLRREIKNVLSS